MNRKTTLFYGIALAFYGLLAPNSVKAQTTYYVMHEAAGTGDGSSWDNASADIQEMINLAVAGDNVFVGFGTYYPKRKASDTSTITLNDRDNAFVLKEGVKIYGSFAGTEATPEERSLLIPENVTILSGDYNGDDVISGTGAEMLFENNTENAYHVVLAVGTEMAPITTETVLDGFTITGGNGFNANAGNLSVGGQNIGRFTGAGIALYNYASPNLVNLNLVNNTAAYGGGLYTRNFSSPFISNCTISNNYGNSGGGVCNWTDAAPVYQDSYITNNVATAGAGVYNYYALPTLTTVTISGNTTVSGGGGGIYNYYASPVLNDVEISQNTAVTFGGGICSWSNSFMVINGGTIDGNTADLGGGLYINDLSAPVIDGTQISNNNAISNGGGIVVTNNATGVFRNFSVTGNTSATAAGIMCLGAASNFVNGTITGNTATQQGGGLGIYNGSTSLFTNCLVADNSANVGGGMYIFSSTPVFTNATVTHNNATTAGGGIENVNASPLIRNSILYGNSAATASNLANYEGSLPLQAYNIIEGVDGVAPEDWWVFGIDGGGNIDADPLFSDMDNGDFTLTENSPAFNAGNNIFFEEGQVPDLSGITTDLAGNLRIYTGTSIDMGAYELQQTTGIKRFNTVKVSCYPNPVIDELTIKCASEIQSVKIYNATGQNIKNFECNDIVTVLPVSDLKRGVYYITINSNGNCYTKTLLKK